MTDDPDRTVMAPDDGPRPAPPERAGEAPADPPRAERGTASGSGGALPGGHRLQEFRLDRVIGEGGFSIVYAAHDTSLGRDVALKEYLPHSLAARGPSDVVLARSSRHAETFRLGLRSFVNEARLLASFDHPALVKVYRFWEQNGTAYMVMPHYQGPTLRSWLRERRQRPDEAWLRALLDPLLQALAVIHAAHVFHRDIAPDNVLLLGSDPEHRPQPLLLDFGAARRVIGDATQALTVILKPGFAPIEQYAESASMKQGPWTDVYALCAVLYTAVVGRVPVPAVSRIVTDELLPAASLAHSHYSHRFLAAIDRGLAVRPEHRPQSVFELREMFEASGVSAAFATPLGLVPAPAASGHDDEATVVGSDPLADFLVPRDAAASASPLQPPPQPPLQPPPRAPRRAEPALAAEAEPAAARPKSMSSIARRPLLLAALGVAAVAGVGVAVWSLTQPESPVAAVSESQAPAPATTPAATSSTAAPPPSLTPAPAPAPAAVPEPVAFSVLGALEDIVLHADRSIAVAAETDRPQIAIGRDRLQFRIRSSEDGFVYVFTGGTDKSHFYLLFPNQLDRNHRIEAGRDLVLPRPGWAITASGPPGTNHIAVVVSRRPREFEGTGLRRATEREPIPEVDLATARQRWAARTPGASPFIGTPVCPAGTACDGGYGATMLEVSEIPAR